MSIASVVWLNTSPSLQYFDKRLLRYLSGQANLVQWEYSQNQDEASLLDVGILLLHDYFLKSGDRPVHLAGHSTGGLLSLLYARKYPENVQSVTLLGVGVDPMIDWIAHYYVQRQLSPCSRQAILNQMVYSLFGYQNCQATKMIRERLEAALECSLSPHSLLQRASLASGGVDVPLLVCGGEKDKIVDASAIQGWEAWLKESDRLWLCPQGGHFFHYFHPQLVGRKMLKFWQSQPSQLSYSKGEIPSKC